MHGGFRSLFNGFAPPLSRTLLWHNKVNTCYNIRYPGNGGVPHHLRSRETCTLRASCNWNRSGTSTACCSARRSSLRCFVDANGAGIFLLYLEFNFRMWSSSECRLVMHTQHCGELWKIFGHPRELKASFGGAKAITSLFCHSLTGDWSYAISMFSFVPYTAIYWESYELFKSKLPSDIGANFVSATGASGSCIVEAEC